MSVELIDKAQRERRNYISRATAPGNDTLNKRTQPNARGIHHRLGYNTIAASYSPGCEIARLSGSSLNRHYSKLKRDEKKQENERLETIQKKYCKADRELMQSLEEINSLRSIIAHKQKYKRKLSIPLFKRGNALHFLSQRTKGKVRDKCTAFHRCLGSQKTFVTLTFINELSDSAGISILNKFLTALRSEFSDLHYVRISERQGNGRIHFHLIINKYLPVVAYNRLWSLQQYNAGIEFPGVSKADFMLRYNESIRREVEEIEHCKSNPDPVMEILNSFDVKKIKHINGLSYYLTKYITKNENKGFGCSAWHCSRAVSKLFIKTLCSRSTFSNAASFVNSTLNKSTGEIKKTKPVIGKYHCLFYIENKSFFLPEMSELETVNKWIVDGMLPDRLPEVDDNQILKLYSN
jgi:hypothetical protein